MKTLAERHQFISGAKWFAGGKATLASCLIALASGSAADVAVTTSNDENNGSLDPAMGSGTSLREAVLHAPAGSTIVFAPALHGFVFALNDGQMVISRNLTIDGSTLSIGVEVNAQEMSRVFEVQAGKTVSMIRLRIVGGKVTGDGGGIRNAGNLTLRDCELTSNQATGGGGAIENSGTLSLNACTLAGNTAGVGGGGIEHASGVLSLTNCTMTGNSAQWGGAIDGDGTSTIRLYSCTLSGNHASDKGGGIEETTGTLLLENSIVAGNTATNSGPDLKASSINTQLGVSLISSTNGLGGSYSGIVGTADLMPLNDYGGPTRTLLPLPGSPARNAGGATALTVDQRGLPRVVGAAVDIGAVEVQPPLVVTTDLDFGPGSLRHTVGIAPSGSTITFDPSLDGASIDVYPTMTGDGGPEVSNPIILDKCLIIDASEREDLEVVGRVLPAYHTPTELLQLPHETSVAIYNLRFTGAGGPGSAIQNEGDLLMDHCQLVGNYSTSGDGGAITNGGTANLTLTRCLLSGNRAHGGPGGAIYNVGSAVLDHTIIAGNRSTGWWTFGGGIANCGKLEMTDSVLTGNTSEDSGGGAIYSYGTLSMTRCTVEGNDSHGSGSGLYLENGGSLTACTISGNRGEEGEGAGIFHLGGGLLTLVQCTISDNHAGLGSGGGIASHGALTVASCTIAGNSAEIEGGGISLVAPAALTLSNSIVAGNSASLGADIRGAIDVQQGVSLVASTDGILNSFGGIVADPQLGPLALNGGPTLTRLPLAGSPAINGGGTTPLALDQRGYPRVVAGKLDIGAVETGNGIPLILVDTLVDEDNGPGVGSTSLRDAITAALPGSIISFAPALNGGTITLTIDQLTVDKNLIIDATPLASGITLTGNVSRAFEVGISRHASIRGLTISGIRSDEVGGAAVMNSGNLELLRCRLIRNLAAYGAVYNSGNLAMENCTVAENDGGGLHNGYGRADLTRCAFTGNVSDGRGGGISNSGELYLTECRLESNSARFGGGGMVNFGSKTSKVDRCTFAGNLSGGAFDSGGGIRNFGVLVVTNSTLSGNQYRGGTGGGGIGNSGDLRIVSSTLSGNSTTGQGGGIINAVPGKLSLENTIVAANTADGGGPDLSGGILSEEGVNLLGSTEGVTGPFTGIVADPLLAPLGDNGGPTPTMLPLPGSPAIDAGGATSLPVDQRGFPRVVGAKVDIGSVEAGAASPGLVVNTTVDENDGSAVGDVSLRDAIAESPPGAVITFSPSVNAQVILLTSGTLVIGKDLRIDASSLQAGIGVSGDDRFRVFDIAAGSNVSMLNLSIVDGRVPASGGGIRNGGHLILADCEIALCSTGDDGAGIYNSGSLLMTDSRVTSNVAADSGGGIASQGPVSLRSCVVSSNNADNGGAIYNDGAVITIEDCTFDGNTVDNSPGGGAIDNDGGEVSITRSTLSGNRSASGGGAIENNGTLNILACTLSGNTAAVGGGAIEHAAGVLDLTSSTLAGNTAKYGGAIDGDGTSTIRLNCCTVANNHASDKGGGIEETTGTLVLENSIVGANSATNSGPDLKVSSINSELGVNLVSSTSGLGGNFHGIVADPQLYPLANYGGPTQTISPRSTSPVIDAGGPTTLTVDQRGLPRLAGAALDIGSVEVEVSTVVSTAADSGPGSLRYAVRWLPEGAVVTFSPALDGQVIGIDSPLPIAKDVTIDATEREDVAISGRDRTGVFTVNAGVTAVFRGLEIRDGDRDAGGAIFNSGDLTLEDCVVSDNIADEGGGIFNGTGGAISLVRCELVHNGAYRGGAVLSEGIATFTNTLIHRNSSTGNGEYGNFGGGVLSTGDLTLVDSVVRENSSVAAGGIASAGGSFMMVRCTVEDNLAMDGVGGGIFVGGGGGTISGCTISGNLGLGEGGGIYHGLGVLTIANCTIQGNISDTTGGGVYSGAETKIASCTLSGNGSIGGGGIHIDNTGGYYNGYLTLENSIVAGNTNYAEEFGQDVFGPVDIELGVNLLGSTDGVTTPFAGIVADPLLSPLGNYGGPTMTMLPLPGSPAIDAGGATTLTLDQRGFNRVVGAKVDIGSVETGNVIPP